MVQINEQLSIDDSELTWTFTTSGGPGGQNVNKVATRAVLRWLVRDSEALPKEVKERLIKHQKNRITKDGELIIYSQRFRDQERNRQDCLEKLQEMILWATRVPKARKKTRPSRASKERRIANKKHRASVKSLRRPPRPD